MKDFGPSLREILFTLQAVRDDMDKKDSKGPTLATMTEVRRILDHQYIKKFMELRESEARPNVTGTSHLH